MSDVSQKLKRVQSERARSRWIYALNMVNAEHRRKRQKLTRKLSQLTDEQVDELFERLELEKEPCCISCLTRSRTGIRTIRRLVNFLTSDEVEELVEMVNDMF